jgi:ABC-type multidrug transport system fused ATPase/permease subunit
VFVLNFFFSIILRIIYTFYANKQSIGVNRAISSLLFQKILKLPQRFVAKAGSGKLVSLVSGELQTLEKTLWYIPYILIAPLSNFACFAYFAVYFYEASAIAFFLQMVIVIIFVFLSVKATKLKYIESKIDMLILQVIAQTRESDSSVTLLKASRPLKHTVGNTFSKIK